MSNPNAPTVFQANNNLVVINKKLDKLCFNNFVVGLRSAVKQGLVHTINKLTRDASQLRKKKTQNESQKEKNTRKAERFIQEVKFLKSLHPRDIAKFASLYKKTFSEVGGNPNSSIEERALCRISEHKRIKSAVIKFRGKFPNWAEEIPVIIKSLGLNYRRKRLERLSEVGQLERVTEREKKLFLLLHEYAGLDIDPKMFKKGPVKLTNDRYKEPLSLNDKKNVKTISPGRTSQKLHSVPSSLLDNIYKSSLSLSEDDERDEDCEESTEDNESDDDCEESTEDNESEGDCEESNDVNKSEDFFKAKESFISGNKNIIEWKEDEDSDNEENNSSDSCDKKDFVDKKNLKEIILDSKKQKKIDIYVKTVENTSALEKHTLKASTCDKKVKNSKGNKSTYGISSIFSTNNDNDNDNTLETQGKPTQRVVLAGRSSEISSNLEEKENAVNEIVEYKLPLSKMSNITTATEPPIISKGKKIREAKQIDSSKFSENFNISSNKLPQLSEYEDEDFLKHKLNKFSRKSPFFFGNSENIESLESRNELRGDTQEENDLNIRNVNKRNRREDDNSEDSNVDSSKYLERSNLHEDQQSTQYKNKRNFPNSRGNKNSAPGNRYERRRQQFGDADEIENRRRIYREKEEEYKGGMKGRGRGNRKSKFGRGNKGNSGGREAIINKNNRGEAAFVNKETENSSNIVRLKKRPKSNVIDKTEQSSFHPSWEAKRKIAERSSILEFQGTRKTFDD